MVSGLFNLVLERSKDCFSDNLKLGTRDMLAHTDERVLRICAHWVVVNINCLPLRIRWPGDRAQVTDKGDHCALSGPAIFHGSHSGCAGTNLSLRELSNAVDGAPVGLAANIRERLIRLG